jgi:hypothetical protein
MGYLVIFGVLVLFAAVLYAIAKHRGANPVFWSAMGFLFGPLALPFVFLSRKTAA